MILTLLWFVMEVTEAILTKTTIFFGGGDANHGPIQSFDVTSGHNNKNPFALDKLRHGKDFFPHHRSLGG